MPAYIKAIEFELPVGTLANEAIASNSANWTAEKILDKTGIAVRHIASKTECASDFALKAAEKILKQLDKSKIDYLIYCTQSPDYFLPTSACIMQHKLELPTNCGAIDINLGCSGYVYGLGMAQALIQSGQASNILFLTGDTYTKYINPNDNSVRTLFGDAGTATLITDNDGICELNNRFVYGTDGKGWNNLIVTNGGARNPYDANSPEITDAVGNTRSDNNLYMNGPEIFAFTSKAVPKLVKETLEKNKLLDSDIDLYVFHQANSFMLKHLQRMLKIPAEKFFIDMEDCGNTVSSTIPIALHKANSSGKIKKGMTVMLVGFGVGYSWGATIINF